MTIHIKNGRFLVVGGAGLIACRLVDQLLAFGVRKVCVYDLLSRGVRESLEQTTQSNRCELFADGVAKSYGLKDVRDCARANILAMRTGTRNQCNNIGTEIRTSIAQLAETPTTNHPNKIKPKF